MIDVSQNSYTSACFTTYGDLWKLCLFQIYGSGLSSPVLVTYLRHEILLQLQPLGTGKLLCECQYLSLQHNLSNNWCRS